MFLTHKVALDPTDVQATACSRHAGYARVAWNWGVNETRRALDAGEPDATSHYRLRPLFNSVKDVEFPWCREQSQRAAKYALIDLGNAWARFWADRKKKSARKVRRPRYHARKRGQSFRADNGPGTVRVKVPAGGKPRLVIPNVGKVRMLEAPRWPGPVRECTVVKTGRRWFACLVFELPDPEPAVTAKPVIGVDVGLRKQAATFDGVDHASYANPRPLGANLTRLKRLSRKLARSLRTHGRNRPSNRRRRVIEELRAFHARIACSRDDHARKTALAIAKRAGTVVVETLSVEGWKRLRPLARSTSDAAPAAFLGRLRQTCARVGVPVVEVDRWYPSSKTCSVCGNVHQALGMEEQWTCPFCGAQHDRDENAAINLWRLGQPSDVKAVSDRLWPAVAREASTGQMIPHHA